MSPLRSWPDLLAAVAVLVLTAVLTQAQTTPDYEREIKPLLRERCVACHGQVKQKGGLRLDTGALIVKGGKHGAVVVPGKGDAGELMERVLSHEEDHRMPPEGKPLPPDMVDLLRRWIVAGASYPMNEPVPRSPAEHWSFQPVKKLPVPLVKNSDQVRNPIDAFVQARLESQGQRPAPTSAPMALLRRVHLDITGLPPNVEEQRVFEQKVNGAHALSDAHAALDGAVDRLLNTTAYGERWARHWLDVVRYADSNGYERDAEKPLVWQYRDYVIRALNADMPYDRFVMEQIAGDELPGQNAGSVIATGFLRLGHWDDEPADPAADRYDQLDDIVSTTGHAFLGLTIGCARCHDHKFEPLSTRDYYSLVAVFNPLQRPVKGRTELTVPTGDGEAYAWKEASPTAPDTHVLVRGSPGNPGEKVAPAVPAILVKEQPAFPQAGKNSTQRRLGLAQWLASRDNPLTARVMVNRAWQQHFGRGLVTTANDFGLMGEPPSHPELLDWLAHWFMHEGGWSMKNLHRLILTSHTWRQVKGRDQDVNAMDKNSIQRFAPEYRRLEVEAIRDSMLAVSGRLNPKAFGPAMKPRIPEAALEANTDKAAIWKPSDETEASRRTIYAYVKRGLVLPMLEVLDLADTVASCQQRQVTTVAPQALSLFNGEFVNQQARDLAARLKREAGTDPEKQLRHAWRLALCREPTPAELARMQEFLQQEPLEQVCRVLLNLNEFVYPE